MLKGSETGLRIFGDSLHYSCNFSLGLTLLQIETKKTQENSTRWAVGLERVGKWVWEQGRKGGEKGEQGQGRHGLQGTQLHMQVWSRGHTALGAAEHLRGLGSISGGQRAPLGAAEHLRQLGSTSGNWDGWEHH